MFLSGLASAWVIPLNVSFVQAVPSAYRGQAFGVAVSGLYGVQGIGRRASPPRACHRAASSPCPAAWG